MDDYEKQKMKDEEKKLAKAEAKAKKVERREVKAIDGMQHDFKAKDEIKKMTKAALNSVHKLTAGLGIDTTTTTKTPKAELGESQEKYNPKSSDGDKAEIRKLDKLEAKLKGNLQKTEKSMTTVEKNFEKSSAATAKLKKQMDSFKKATEKAKSLASSAPDDEDELGETPTDDLLSHETDQLMEMSKGEPQGISAEQARHLEEDYHRVATTYVNNLQKIMADAGRPLN